MDAVAYKKNSQQIINQLNLEDVQKDLLSQSWLDFISHLESRIEKTFFWNRFLSITGIIGGIAIPAVSSLYGDQKLIVSILGVLTASSIAVNQNQKYNERWQHFRNQVEFARIEGENYLSLAGENYENKTHKEAFAIFMERLSVIKTKEIHKYFTSINDNKAKIPITKIEPDNYKP